MFLDFESLSRLAGSPPPVAIIGTGPAGLSLAMALAGQGIASLLVEAGGRNARDYVDPEPYRGESADRPYPLGASRLRYFGGTSGHWGGWCRPLDPVDFEPVAGVPYSGWPITRDEAYRHLARAHEILEIPDDRYDTPEVLAAAATGVLPSPDEDEFQHAVFRLSPPTRFGTRYWQDVADSKLIHCALDTRLVSVERTADGRTRLHLKGAGGQLLALGTGAHVLAMGGVENARSLLWSNRLHRQALGGAGDWIGRCFLDHFGIAATQVLAPVGLDYGPRATAAGMLMTKLVPNPRRVAAGEVPNHMITLLPSDGESFLQGSYGESALLFPGRSGPMQTYNAIAVSGQRPNRDSRVLLGDAVDADGVPRVVIDWRIADPVFSGLLDSLERFGAVMSAAGLGRMRKTAFRPPLPTEALSTGMHHIGTTRMAASEDEGVVDTNCRVFGSEDLYVAGSSVFSTGGYANPTLTLCALALRLAEHLGQVLPGGRA
jgi:hypothetical protein